MPNFSLRSMRALVCTSVLSTALVAAAASAADAGELSPPAADDGQRLSAQQAEAMSSETFLAHHPDVRWQQRGTGHYRNGRFVEAARDFRRAARYSDKPSQGMLGQMHWRGEGVAVDRATAYAWMDLAAERGYPFFLRERETMWRLLSEDERARVQSVGQALYAEFGDDVARPRLAQVMRAGHRRSVVGSRLGYDAGVRIAQPGADGSFDLSGGAARRAYELDSRYWHPDTYFQTQDLQWRDMPKGEIIVQPLRPDDGAPPEPEAEPSR